MSHAVGPVTKKALIERHVPLAENHATPRVALHDNR
jgi:hypothetical protein